MIRGAHFSDLHYANATLAEVDRCFSFAIDQAIAQGVDFAVISGDSTDHALDVHAPAVEALARNIRRLADHCPVLMLQGTFSHEPPGTLNVFRLLGGNYPVHVADRLQQVALTPDGTWLASESWRFDAIPAQVRALFSCVPTVNKAVVAATVGAAGAAEAIGEQIALLLRGFAPINERARRDGIPTIGVSHGTVNGCVTEHGVPMAGLDHEFTTSALFGCGATAFMLGHIHKHQAWEQDGKIIAYAGSIGRLHYGEEGDKGFLLWEIGANAVGYELVQTPARRTVDIMFGGMLDMDALRQCAANAEIDGAFVRLRWVMPEEDRHAIDRQAIEALFIHAAALKMEGRVIPVVRTRAAGISQESSIHGKVRKWAEVTEVKPEPMLLCLETLLSKEPDDIASAILAQAAAAEEGTDRQERIERTAMPDPSSTEVEEAGLF